MQDEHVNAHSKNGNTASVVSGHERIGGLPVADDDACGERGCQRRANHQGRGCLQNSRPASPSVNPFRAVRSVVMVMKFLQTR